MPRVESGKFAFSTAHKQRNFWPPEFSHLGADQFTMVTIMQSADWMLYHRSTLSLTAWRSWTSMSSSHWILVPIYYRQWHIRDSQIESLVGRWVCCRRKTNETDRNAQEATWMLETLKNASESEDAQLCAESSLLLDWIVANFLDLRMIKWRTEKCSESLLERLFAEAIHSAGGWRSLSFWIRFECTQWCCWVKHLNSMIWLMEFY